jgi:DNA repair exonuclease SbcCD ATPase subunit
MKLIDHFITLLKEDQADIEELLIMLDQLLAAYPTLNKNECKTLLQQKDFQKLIEILRQFKHENVPVQEETNIEGLRTRLKFLELQHAILAQKLASLEQQIIYYQQKHYQELGEYISKLLDLKWEILSLKKEKDKAFEPDFEQIHKDREEYQQLHEEKNEVPSVDLNNEENEKLQKYFRLASKLCHPDLVIDEFKSEAEKWFVELNKAYSSKNLERVMAIYSELIQKEIHFPKITEPLSDIELLKANIKRLQQKIEELQQQINKIETSSLYRNIISHQNLDEYFTSMKEHFKKEITLLEKELKDLVDER